MDAVAWGGLDREQRERWAAVLDLLVAALPREGRTILVDGASARAQVVADRLADRLQQGGRECVRLNGSGEAGARGAGAVVAAGGPGPVVVAGRPRADPVAGGSRADPVAGGPGAVVVAVGASWREREEWHLTVWVRSRPAPGENGGYRGDRAHAVIDLHDPGWPVVRHLDPVRVAGEVWYRAESQAFFAARAATWDVKFGADLPAYALAVAEADLAPGSVVADVGCGTGRAFPALREAIGPGGTIFGLDLTPQMLDAARERAGACRATLVVADARRLPLAAGSVDAVFAAGLVTHLPDPAAGFGELARVTRPGGRLVLFHPSGRAALAARHGRSLRPDEPLAEGPLRALTAATGWRLVSYDDPADRFHAVALRT